MENRYNEQEAQQYRERFRCCPEELALRVYTSQLIGREDDLVLHGGGNTSAKATITSLLGEEQEVIYVKGSGWDLVSIEPAGFPALDLAYLKRLRGLESLSDEQMVNQFRTHMLDASAPNPSIETLVHAFLPHRFIDHTHADAVVTLTNQVEAKRHIRAALGDTVGILPFIMPGFPLAKAVAELYEANPAMDCIVLLHHGIFTFADDAETSYSRMIHYVGLAEQYIAAQREINPGSPVMLAHQRPDPALVLPVIRGALSFLEKDRRRTFMLTVRNDEEILAALDRADAESLFTTGVLTPDHVIRTKNYPVFLDFEGRDEPGIVALLADRLDRYRRHYEGYFEAQTSAKKVVRTRLDAMPRIFLIRGLGIVAAGKTTKDAVIAADIAQHTVLAKINGASVGPYRELGEEHIFDMEYWSLEQVKLGRKQPLPLEGRVALVTGGGGAIAAGIGERLLAAGARVFLSDIDPVRLAKVEEKLAARFGKGSISSLVMDVTREDSARQEIEEIVRTCGGIDIIVPNAGIAHVAKIEDLDEEKFRRVIDVNLMGVFTVIKAAIPIFRRQATGGHVVINSSKNVFDPGAAFGAYSASKAGAHQLGKIAALELAELAVKVNMINADAIFSEGEIASGLWDVVGPDRMRARNLDPAGLRDYYRQRNLLKTEVLAGHVGNAVVFFASDLTPTTGATLPVDGGIPAAFPR